MAIGCICCCLPCITAELEDFYNILKFSLVSIQKVVPVHAEKSYHILNFLLQTSINVSDNSITIVLQW